MNFISFENRRNSVHQQFTQDIAETAHQQFTQDSLCDQFVFISLDVDVRPFLACMTSAPGAALQQTTKVLLKRSYLHAAGASLHQPKYSFKRVQIFMSHSLFASWAAMSILSFLAWMWQDKQVDALAVLQTSNQSTPQTVVSSCSWRLAPPTKVLT